MCGIAGYIGLITPNASQINNCSQSFFHRGPDGDGCYKKRTINGEAVVLIHRRLAIIDLDKRSNQPMRVGEKILIFNGEIYNYIEIRKELKQLGYNFSTNGDTEVLAKALHCWKEEAFTKLEGMWAFAWFDEKTGELLLSRDRFGEKPLYFWRCNKGIYFASEIKALTTLAGKIPSINKEQIYRYLINGYKSLYKGEDTFYENIEQVKPGSYIKYANNINISFQYYWLPKSTIDQNLTYQDAVEKTKETLIKAVKLRMRSDVPLAFCMSGGVDSNSLIAIASKILKCDVHGFTVVNQDERYEEKKLVELAVENLGIKQTNIKVSKKDFLSNLKILINSHNSPVSVISYYVHWQLLNEIAKRGYKVTISGTGADELFTGYYDHHNLYLGELYGQDELFHKSYIAWENHLKPIVRNPYLKNPNLYIEDKLFRKHIYLNNDIFSTFFYNNWNEPFHEKDYGASLLRNRMLNELCEETVPVILHEDDLNAMQFSMENRSPFLDRDLFELAYSIPTKHLIKKGYAKSVLRDAMRNIVPDPILDNRKKIGFNAPIMDLLDTKDNCVKSNLLDNSPIFDIIKKEKIENLLKEETLPNSFSKFLFSFINAKFFLEMQS